MKIKSVQRVVPIETIIPATRPISDKAFEYSENHTYKMWVLINKSQRWRMFERFVPKGLIIDKRTSPRIAWSFVPRDGLCEFGADGHDPDYMTAGYTRNMDLGAYATINGCKCTMSRRACDQLYQKSNDKIKPHSIEDERDYVVLRIFGKLFKYWGKRKR